MSSTLNFDSQCTNLEAIKKAAYIFSDRCAIDVSENETSFICKIIPKKDSTIDNYEDFEIEFRNEVLDQELRIEIANKTDGVKNLILAFAFSKSGLSDHG